MRRRIGIALIPLAAMLGFGSAGTSSAQAAAATLPKPNIDRMTEALPSGVVQIRRRGRGFRGRGFRSRGFRGRGFRGRGFRRGGFKRRGYGRRFYGGRRFRKHRRYRPRVRFYINPGHYYGRRYYSPYKCYKRCRYRGHSRRYCHRRCDYY